MAGWLNGAIFGIWTKTRKYSSKLVCFAPCHSVCLSEPCKAVVNANCLWPKPFVCISKTARRRLKTMFEYSQNPAWRAWLLSNDGAQNIRIPHDMEDMQLSHNRVIQCRHYLLQYARCRKDDWLAMCCSSQHIWPTASFHQPTLYASDLLNQLIISLHP